MHASRQSLRSVVDATTVLHREYDVVCPLPSSRGPASKPNVEVAEVIARSFGPVGGDGGPAVSISLVQRVQLMLRKSTATDKWTRQQSDSPRLMHYDCNINIINRRRSSWLPLALKCNPSHSNFVHAFIVQDAHSNPFTESRYDIGGCEGVRY